nr:uncharacterized protein LOC116651568 [Drosophila virilis]
MGMGLGMVMGMGMGGGMVGVKVKRIKIGINSHGQEEVVFRVLVCIFAALSRRLGSLDCVLPPRDALYGRCGFVENIQLIRNCCNINAVLPIELESERGRRWQGSGVRYSAHKCGNKTILSPIFTLHCEWLDRRKKMAARNTRVTNSLELSLSESVQQQRRRPR